MILWCAVVATLGVLSAAIELPPAFGVFDLFGRGRDFRQAQNPLKRYSGRRARNDSVVMVYFHDQTVAVAELGPKKLLLGCELVEV